MIKGYYDVNIKKLAPKYIDMEPLVPNDAIIIGDNIFCENAKEYAIKTCEKLCSYNEISTVKILHDYVYHVTYQNVPYFIFWEQKTTAFSKKLNCSLYYCRSIYNPANAIDFEHNFAKIKKFNAQMQEPATEKPEIKYWPNKNYGTPINYNKYHNFNIDRIDYVTTDISEFSDMVIHELPVFDDVALKMVIIDDKTRIFNCAEHELMPIQQGSVHLMALPRFCYINYLLTEENIWKYAFDKHLDFIRANPILPKHLNGYVGVNKNAKRIYDKKPEIIKPYFK